MVTSGSCSSQTCNHSHDDDSSVKHGTDCSNSSRSNSHSFSHYQKLDQRHFCNFIEDGNIRLKTHGLALSKTIGTSSKVLRERNSQSCRGPKNAFADENHYSSAGGHGKENKNPLRDSKTRQQQQYHDKCKSLEEVMSPLNVQRLRPIRQKTRNVVVSILEDKSVCLEFVKQHGKDTHVMEVFKVTSDGIRVTTYQPNGKVGVLLQNDPPETPKSAVSYAFSGLPQRLWKKYQYADKFVHLVRLKTPKVDI